MNKACLKAIRNAKVDKDIKSLYNNFIIDTDIRFSIEEDVERANTLLELEVNGKRIYLPLIIDDENKRLVVLKDKPQSIKKNGLFDVNIGIQDNINTYINKDNKLIQVEF